MSWKDQVRGLTGLLVGLLAGGCSGDGQLVGSDGSTVGPGNPSGGAQSVSGGTTTVFYDQVVLQNDLTQCLPRQLPLDSSGVPSCTITAARRAAECGCTEPGLAPAGATLAEFTRQQLRDSGGCGPGTNFDCAGYCVCIVTPATGASLTECQTVAEPSPATVGWCYVSDQGGAAQEALVAGCNVGMKQTLRRFGQSLSGETFYALSCVDTPPSIPLAKLGETCVPSDEFDPTFPGFNVKEISVENSAAQCQTDLCLVNHFQGRVSCPYGTERGDTCSLPGSSEPVSVEVRAQIKTRQADTASICSCRCDGAGPGPYCTCPESMQCEHLIDDLGNGSSAIAGSYCTPRGTQYGPTQNRECEPGTCGPAHPY